MHRAIKSQSHHDHARITRNPTYNLRGPQTHQSGRYYDDRPSRNSFVGLPSPVGEVTTYLTTEFVFAKFTDSPTDLLGYKEHELYGVKGLFDIVSPTDRDKLYRLSRMILDEIQRKEPTYHYPPPANLYSAIQNASPAEVMSNLQNSREFPETLQLRLSTSHYRRFAVRIYVVKTSVFFVVARFSASEVPPLLQFQSPIDTYGTSTYIPPHSMTAPLTSPSFPGPSNSRHYAGDLPGPLSPYSLHASRAMQSPVDSRPRTLQTDSQQYPSLAQYSNASSTMSTALTQGPGRSPLSPHPTHPDPSLSFGRGSDNPDISNDLRLPPLRDIKTVEERGAPAAQLKAVENSRSETTRKRERIAVEEMLQ